MRPNQVLLMLIACAACSGRIINLNADGSGEYASIQAAIESAQDGDEIVLGRGVYSGPGNYNINFMGKALTLRSQAPYDNECMRSTVIDAMGKGVIVRFVNDEGPGTVIEGFTVWAGDTSKQVRGEAGFFEFSQGARPTTRRLRSKETFSGPRMAGSLPSVYDPNRPGWIPPFNRRVWNGYDPFHQPVATTDYHGSGDADNDGLLTIADVTAAGQMANKTRAAVNRADADGDGDVDNADVSLINAALSGGTLGGWWNSLSAKTQRNSWINKIKTRERTDAHLYDINFFVCHHFAYQMFIHCAFLRGDLTTDFSELDGGQTVFNVPMYFVSVGAPTSHAINAILVGDDPLKFAEWRFIEPQDDTDAVPGAWNMRYNSELDLSAPNLYWNAESIVKFKVLETGVTLVNSSPGLVLTRQPVQMQQADNRPDTWNPRILEINGQAYVFFEKNREDMDRTTSVHCAKLGSNLSDCTAITLSNHFTRLHDIVKTPDGQIHLLWEGKGSQDKITLFHGLLDTVQMKATAITQVTPGLILPATARLAVRPNGEVHAMWYVNMGFYGAYEYGIFWAKKTGTSWATPVNITPGADSIGDDPDWINRQHAKFAFDTEVIANGDILLAWVERFESTYYISQLRYNGTSWVSTRIDSTDWNNSIRGLDLCKSSDGKVHMAYWRGKRTQPGGTEEGRGSLYNRSFDGTNWTAGTVIDTGTNTACPRMAAGKEGGIYIVYELKLADRRVVPVWNSMSQGNWNVPIQVEVRPDANAWYPVIACMEDDRAVACWSSQSSDWVTIEKKTVNLLDGDFEPDGDVDYCDLAFFSEVWLERNAVQGDFAPEGGDGTVNFLDLTHFAHNWIQRLFISVFYREALDSNPGWTAEGDWAWGIPTGGGQRDPSSGRSGNYVYGYNLNGNYPANMTQKHLTSGPINCSGKRNVHLRFWRWLGVESPTYDHASVQVSRNVTDWVTVWQNATGISDTSWQQVDLDISAQADDQNVIYLRWTMGSTDSSLQYGGWNIDDIELAEMP